MNGGLRIAGGVLAAVVEGAQGRRAAPAGVNGGLRIAGGVLAAVVGGRRDARRRARA